MDIEDRLAAAEDIVRQIERGDLRLADAISAFREACLHLAESERLLDAARVEVERLVTAARPGANAETEPLSLT